DGMSPSMPSTLETFAPNARYVDGEQLMRTVRAIKLPAEIECIRTAIAITEGALAAIRDDVQPGVTEQELKGRYHEEMCRFGINHPAMEGTFCATPRACANGDGPPPHPASSTRSSGAGGHPIRPTSDCAPAWCSWSRATSGRKAWVATSVPTRCSSPTTHPSG